MPINLEGVELLKADLRAHASNYKQSTFGRIAEDQDGDESACGTEQCMAGFCYLRVVGQAAFTAAIQADTNYESVQQLCVDSGLAQLGIECDPESCPDIFESSGHWPNDLAGAYQDAKTADERVEVACAALDRLNPDGTIKALDQI